MTFWEAYLIGGLAVLGIMVLLWLLSPVLRAPSIVDSFLLRVSGVTLSTRSV
jgi:hypothetical protein